MNTNTRVVVFAGATLLGACIALPILYAARDRVQENRFTSAVEVRESRQRDRLPAMLPRSATEIHAWHDGRAKVSLGSFRFDPRERVTIEPALEVGLRQPIRIDRDPSFATVLPRDPSEMQLAGEGFEFYTNDDFALAIRWKDGIAYFWLAPLGAVIAGTQR